MTYQQIDCVDVSPDVISTTRLLVWVDASRRVKRGDVVTFKETGDKQWRVTGIYDTRVEEVNRGWGLDWGLDLPKSQRTER